MSRRARPAWIPATLVVAGVIAASAQTPRSVADEPAARLEFYEVGPGGTSGPPELLSRLHDSDTAIEVVQRGSLPFAFSVADDAALELRQLTAMSPAALLVRVDRLDGRLTTDETWLTSTVTTTVQSVLKNTSALPVREGGQLSFERDGGALTVGSQTILARKSWERLPRAGRTYLMFFMDYKGALWPDLGLHSFDVTDGTLKRLAHVPGGGGDRGMTLEAALAAIRSAAP